MSESTKKEEKKKKKIAALVAIWSTNVYKMVFGQAISSKSPNDFASLAVRVSVCSQHEISYTVL